ncbi:uncharacterized protein SCHCODRAFT_02498960 [Schizophyllum commune H4-8]|nr:uncharacterized protein SCHCODRAFT_02498960 [Schizophyllum commune H4-8]KAI5893241.1 hypothetical protein SCHCODRAFT_02498960 [Schizophyllum commune H4-8]
MSTSASSAFPEPLFSHDFLAQELGADRVDTVEGGEQGSDNGAHDGLLDEKDESDEQDSYVDLFGAYDSEDENETAKEGGAPEQSANNVEHDNLFLDDENDEKDTKNNLFLHGLHEDDNEGTDTAVGTPATKTYSPAFEGLSFPTMGGPVTNPPHLADPATFERAPTPEYVPFPETPVSHEIPDRDHSVSPTGVKTPSYSRSRAESPLSPVSASILKLASRSPSPPPAIPARNISASPTIITSSATPLTASSTHPKSGAQAVFPATPAATPTPNRSSVARAPKARIPFPFKKKSPSTPATGPEKASALDQRDGQEPKRPAIPTAAHLEDAADSIEKANTRYHKGSILPSGPYTTSASTSTAARLVATPSAPLKGPSTNALFAHATVAARQISEHATFQKPVASSARERIAQPVSNKRKAEEPGSGGSPPKRCKEEEAPRASSSRSSSSTRQASTSARTLTAQPARRTTRLIEDPLPLPSTSKVEKRKRSRASEQDGYNTHGLYSCKMPVHSTSLRDRLMGYVPPPKPSTVANLEARMQMARAPKAPEPSVEVAAPPKTKKREAVDDGDEESEPAPAKKTKRVESTLTQMSKKLRAMNRRVR